jgi:hypothetical protein
MLNLNRSNFQAHPFHLVSPSPWPLYTSTSLLSPATSAVLSFHGFVYAEYNLMLSLTALILSMSFWWRDVYYLHVPSCYATLSSNNILMSGFYTGKGKGKATEVPSDEEKKAKSDSIPELFDSEDEELRKAIALSLHHEKKGGGESSKNKLDSSGRDEFEIISSYTQNWKTLKDQFKSKARLHNDIMLKLEKQNTKGKADIDKLTKYSEETKQLKLELSIVEKKLLQFGVDPSEQFNYQSESDTESDYSFYSSDTGLKRKYSSSDNSETRQNKTVKYLNPDNNKDMTPVFSIYKVGLNFSWIVRFLSVIPSGIFLLVIHLNVFPNLTIPFININLTQLLTLYLIVSLVKWVYKLYNTIIIIYNSYLKKDYFILYTNFYLTSILIIVLLSNNLDIGIFYF